VAAPVTISLDPQRIEAEIARMRERESTGFGGGVKANLFNLVVACLPDSRPEETLEALMGRRPARIIRLACGAAGPAGAAVSGRCYPGTPDRGVCIEEIDVTAGADPLGGGASAWTPLLERDIPTFLWIAGPWTPGNLPPDAAELADKLIVDSSRADDPSAAFAALHRLRGAARGHCAVADLAWSRALPLRVQAARAFDPPYARDALDELAAVRLEGATRTEAQLFFRWLACRLGWRLIDGRDGPSFADLSGRTVSLVHENPAPLARGARLSFAARGAAIEVACSANGCASVGGDRGPWRIASDGELLLAEVDTLRQDTLLDDALGTADGIPISSGSGGGARGP
jgi:glucose-6-phosphate dehydrogenase assembly protein OpcA